MIKIILKGLLSMIVTSFLLIILLYLFRNYIFLTSQGFDAEPHKAFYFFLILIGLSILSFIVTVLICYKKSK